MNKENFYNQIFSVWKNERRSKRLLGVSSVIYSKIRQEIKTLENKLEQLGSEDDISVDLLEERKERLNKILKDLARIRMHKIIHELLAENLTTEGLAIEEIDFVKTLKKIFDAHDRRTTLGEVEADVCEEDRKKAAGEKEQGEKEEEMMTVRILKDIPEIVGAAAEGKEKRSFGPFKKEDIVRLPILYAKTLIMKNAADRIDLPELH